MATVIFTAIGSLIGGPLGGAIGALVGRSVDGIVLGGGNREGPRLNELAVTTSSYGAPLPRQFGRMRVGGQIIWATDLVEHKDKHGGGKGKPSVTEYTYSASFAVALASRPAGAIGRIWADGKLLRGAAGDLKVGGTFRFHGGEGDQAVDPLLEAAEAAGQCPAYRGLAYAVFEDLQLADFGNRIPALTFEVLADTGELSIAQLLGDTLEDCDAAVPLTGLQGIAVEGPLVELLSALDPLYPVDCDACDARLTIRPSRRQTAAIALPEAATSDNREDFGGNAGFTRKRAPDPEQPVSVLRYYDFERDYQPGIQRASGRPLPGQPRTVELPATLGAEAARHLVEQAAKRNSWARQTISWRVTQLDPTVRPGAIVTLPDHPGQWRVSDWEWREHGVDLTLVRHAVLGIATPGSDSGRVNPIPDITIAPTRLVAFELPWDGNALTPVPLLLAAASSENAAWAGASLFADQGDGALLPLGTTGRERAVIGTADAALAPASPLLFDRASSIIVTLAAPDLSLANASMEQLAMGANRALLGPELLQFAAAEPLGAGQWRISGLLRGRGGTEDANASHLAGEAFVLLDGTGAVLDPAIAGMVPGTQVSAIGIGDDVPAVSPVLLAGIGSRPPAPVHARIAPDGEGGIVLTWTRRARGAWAWTDAVDTPLNEQAELYEVTFGPLQAPLARWETATPLLTLAASALAPLIAALPQGPFAIRQRGDRGTSRPLTIELP